MAFHPKLVCVRSHGDWYRLPAHRDCTVRLSVVIVCKATGNVIMELGAERFLKYYGLVQCNKTLSRIN